MSVEGHSNEGGGGGWLDWVILTKKLIFIRGLCKLDVNEYPILLFVSKVNFGFEEGFKL